MGAATGAVRQRRYLEKHPERVKESAGRQRREKEAYIASVKVLCSRCPESDPVCLDFHHRDPTTKEHNVSWMMSKTWGLDRVKEEIAKCDVVCSNCHRKMHWLRKTRKTGG